MHLTTALTKHNAEMDRGARRHRHTYCYTCTLQHSFLAINTTDILKNQQVNVRPNSIYQLGLNSNYQTLYPKTAKYTFFSQIDDLLR